MCVSLHSLGNLWSKFTLSLHALLFFCFTGPKKQVKPGSTTGKVHRVNGVREPGVLLMTPHGKMILLYGRGLEPTAGLALGFMPRARAACGERRREHSLRPCIECGFESTSAGEKGVVLVIVLSVLHFLSMFQEEEKLPKLSDLCFLCTILHNSGTSLLQGADPERPRRVQP